MANNPRDFGAQAKAAQSVQATNDTGTTLNGTAVDRMPSGSQEGFMSCVLVGEVGTVSGGSLTSFDLKLQDSADGATGWADISGAAITQITTADSLGFVDVDLSGAKQFVRAVATTAVTGGTVPVYGLVVLGGAQKKPAA